MTRYCAALILNLTAAAGWTKSFWGHDFFHSTRYELHLANERCFSEFRSGRSLTNISCEYFLDCTVIATSAWISPWCHIDRQNWLLGYILAKKTRKTKEHGGAIQLFLLAEKVLGRNSCELTSPKPKQFFLKKARKARRLFIRYFKSQKNFPHLYRLLAPFQWACEFLLAESGECPDLSQMVGLLVYCSLLLWKSRNWSNQNLQGFNPFLHPFAPNNSNHVMPLKNPSEQTNRPVREKGERC